MEEEAVNVLLTVKVDEHMVQRLQAISPRLNVIVRPAHTAAEIPPDVWGEVEVLLTARVLPDREMAPRLRWVQSIFGGVDAVLDDPLFEGGEVMLTTASGVHAVTMAEFTLGMMLMFAHQIPLVMQWQAAHEWPKDRYDLYRPRLLRGATLGIVGYGSIGREVARLARSFGMKVLAIKRDVMHPASGESYVEAGTGDPEGVLQDRLYPPQALKSMLKECDFVVVLVPRTQETLNLLDAEAIAAMKPGAVLINLARGGIVDEEALVNALRSGKLAGAAFDVFETEPLSEDSPLWDAPNLVISPHVAGSMPDYLERVLDVFAENLKRYLAHRELLNVVDMQRGY